MDKVLQISLDIAVGPECKGKDLAKEITKELSKRGFTIMGAEFQKDITAYYDALTQQHEYLMEVRRYFSDYEQFVVKGKTQEEALAKARELIKNNPHFWGGDYKEGSLRCVKKL